MNTNLSFPKDFFATGWHAGFKENLSLLDFAFLYSALPCNASAVFTKNNFVSHSVTLGKQNIETSNTLRAIVVHSGNANVANGIEGASLVSDMCKEVASQLSIKTTEVLPSSTGVIGESILKIRPKLLSACSLVNKNTEKKEFKEFAKAICTTDAFTKMNSRKLKNSITITGIAKGAGMIQPNMATMLAYVFTDAEIEKETLKFLHQKLTKISFNRISVDSDTSTNDTFVFLANGSSKKEISYSKDTLEYFFDTFYKEEIIQKKQSLASVETLQILTKKLPNISEESLDFLICATDLCIELAQKIVLDGEGTTKMLALYVEGASNESDALLVGRSVMNSPLFKTSLYGDELNWGRIIMAIGKVSVKGLNLEKLKIFIEDVLIFPKNARPR